MSYLTRSEIEALGSGVFQTQLANVATDVNVEANARDESLTALLYQMQESASVGVRRITVAFGSAGTLPLQKFARERFQTTFSAEERENWHAWLVTSVGSFRDALLATAKMDSANVTLTSSAEDLTCVLTVNW